MKQIVCSDGIPAVPRNRKLSEEENARNSVYRGTKIEANSRYSVPIHSADFCGTKIEANFRNFVPKHKVKKSRDTSLLKVPSGQIGSK